jgi:hypothetical protein
VPIDNMGEAFSFLLPLLPVYTDVSSNINFSLEALKVLKECKKFEQICQDFEATLPLKKKDEEKETEKDDKKKDDIKKDDKTNKKKDDTKKDEKDDKGKKEEEEESYTIEEILEFPKKRLFE